MTDRDPLQILWKSQEQEQEQMQMRTPDPDQKLGQMQSHEQKRDQTQNLSTPDLSDIKSRASRFQHVTSRRNLYEYIVSAFVFYTFGRTAFNTNNTLLMVASVMCMIAVVFVCFKLYGLANEYARNGLDRADNVLNFHRSMLVQQRDALVSVWRWYLAPFIPGAVLFIFASHFYHGSTAPLSTSILFVFFKYLIVGAVFYGIHWLNTREAKKIDTEIAELDLLETLSIKDR